MRGLATHCWLGDVPARGYLSVTRVRATYGWANELPTLPSARRLVLCANQTRCTVARRPPTLRPGSSPPEWSTATPRRRPVSRPTAVGWALGPLDCVKAVVLHTGFLGRLDHGQVGLAATLRAAKGLAAIVDFLKAPDTQRSIAPAYVAAQPHCAERLAQRAEGVGRMGPSFGHDRR